METKEEPCKTHNLGNMFYHLQNIAANNNNIALVGFIINMNIETIVT